MALTRGRAGPTRARPVSVDTWQVTPVTTPWLGCDLTLTQTLDAYAPTLSPHHVFVISEKVAVLLSGRSLPLADYRAGWLARLLARMVRPRPGSRGISVPEKMQYILEHVGVPRVLLACAATAVTRPFGVHGAFYRVAGTLARDLDGGRPPFEHLLFPPLDDAAAREVCDEIATHLGVPVVIADLNDFGGSIRARTDDAPDLETLLRVLSGNPLGQRDTRTPFAVLTPPGARR